MLSHQPLAASPPPAWDGGSATDPPPNVLFRLTGDQLNTALGAGARHRAVFVISQRGSLPRAGSYALDDLLEE